MSYKASFSKYLAVPHQSVWGFKTILIEFFRRLPNHDFASSYGDVHRLSLRFNARIFLVFTRKVFHKDFAEIDIDFEPRKNLYLVIFNHRFQF